MFNKKFEDVKDVVHFLLAIFILIAFFLCCWITTRNDFSYEGTIIGRLGYWADRHYRGKIISRNDLPKSLIKGNEWTITMPPLTSLYNSKVELILTKDNKIHRIMDSEHDLLLTLGQSKNIMCVAGLFYERGKPFIARVHHRFMLSNSLPFECSISPDGSKLAFMTQEGRKKIFRVISTKDSKLLYKLAVFPSWSRFSWAPDSERLLFSFRDGDLYKLDLRNRALEKFAEGREGAWSPDGLWVAFVANDKRHVVVATASGEFIETFEALYPYRITWSPDSHYLAYYRPCGYGRWLLIEMTDLKGYARAHEYAEFAHTHDLGHCLIWTNE